MPRKLRQGPLPQEDGKIAGDQADGAEGPIQSSEAVRTSAQNVAARESAGTPKSQPTPWPAPVQRSQPADTLQAAPAPQPSPELAADDFVPPAPVKSAVETTAQQQTSQPVAAPAGQTGWSSQNAAAERSEWRAAVRAEHPDTYTEPAADTATTYESPQREPVYQEQVTQFASQELQPAPQIAPQDLAPVPQVATQTLEPALQVASPAAPQPTSVPSGQAPQTASTAPQPAAVNTTTQNALETGGQK